MTNAFSLTTLFTGDWMTLFISLVLIFGSVALISFKKEKYLE